MIIDRVDSDWTQMFEAQGGVGFGECDVSRAVVAIVAYGDYAEMTINAVLELNDGRIAVVNADCDTTGWDCQSGASVSFYPSMESAIAHFDDEQARLFCGIDRAATDRS